MEDLKNIGKYRNMFNTATSFLEAAESLFNKENSFVDGLHTPAIVNYAFASEVYLKLLLLKEKSNNKKTHKLFDLYKQLSEGLQKEIAFRIFNSGIWIGDCWGRNELENISNTFVKWRYCYEESTLHINTGYLQTLCIVLREMCCEKIFNSEWECLKGVI